MPLDGADRRRRAHTAQLSARDPLPSAGQFRVTLDVRKMAAFTLTNARAMLTAPVAASVGGRAAKAAVPAAKAAPAFARVSVPARHFNGLAASGVSSAFRAPIAARAFHLTAFAADEEGAEAPAEGPVKLYVGNLSWGMDDASLGDLFGEYDASEMTVVKDNESGRSRGFGFVTLADQASADKAIAALDGVVRAPLPNHREFRIAKAPRDNKRDVGVWRRSGSLRTRLSVVIKSK